MHTHTLLMFQQTSKYSAKKISTKVILLTSLGIGGSFAESSISLLTSTRCSIIVNRLIAARVPIVLILRQFSSHIHACRYCCTSVCTLHRPCTNVNSVPLPEHFGVGYRLCAWPVVISCIAVDWIMVWQRFERLVRPTASLMHR